MSSRLFKRVREELGAAYYVRADADLMLDHGLFAISAGVNHPKLEVVISAILEECAKLTRELVGSAELKKSRDHYAGRFLIGLETSDAMASFYGGQEVLVGKMIDPKEYMRRIAEVSPEEIQAVASDVFKDSGLNLALIGPQKNPAPLQKILRFPLF